MRRADIDEYLMLIAFSASLRSTCRQAHGAVVSQNGIVVSTGYNGSLPGQPHCCDVGCQMALVRERERCVRTIHAERNALNRAEGRGNWIHCTGEPCFTCLSDILSLQRFERIVWWKPYSDTYRDQLYRELPPEQRNKIEQHTFTGPIYQCLMALEKEVMHP